MQFINTSASLTPALNNSINTEITNTHSIIDVLKHVLTPSQIKQVLRVAAKNEAKIAAITSKLMRAHAETIPSGLTMAQFDALTQEKTDSNNLEALFLALAVIATSNSKVVQNNRMYYALQCLNIARQLGKTNTTINDIVKEISVEFSPRTKSGKVATNYTIAHGASVTVSGVKTKKYFVNMGTTVLTFLKLDGLQALTITVNPGSGIAVPLQWTKIVVTNVSTTADGAFSVFIQ